MKLFLTIATTSALVLAAHATDVTGAWKAEFDTQIGRQKYTFTLKQDGTNVSGKADSEIQGEKHEVELREGQIESNVVSFVELLPFQGNEVRITYRGKVNTNEIKFTRRVADFATEELTAKRQASASETNAAPTRRGSGRRFGGPIVLGPDDKAAFPAAPTGFDQRRENIPQGKIETIEYDSTTVGNKRNMLIYTPPGYSTQSKYPVMYLLHGIGGDEEEWHRNASPEVILDNLIADQKAVPMIIVMPNGRAQPNDRAEGDVFASAPAFAVFEMDLIKDVIPFVEAKYPVKADRAYRALAGLSMGGGQSLNFGLGHLDTFAWVGGFSSAPNTKEPEQLVPDPDAATQKLKLLWVSCGDQDGLIAISQRVHTYLKEKQVPHIWHVDSGKHEWPVWKNDLYLFTQRIFR